MEIIKDNSKTVQCTKCGSTLKINKNDVEVQDYEDRMRRYAAYPCTFKCPVCNNNSMIHSNEGWACDLNEIFQG